MNQLNLQRLYKLMMLTTSEHDGEALTAIRKANEVIRKRKTSWAKILHADGYTLKQAQFDFILESEYTNAKAKEIALSLHHHYIQGKTLSTKQNALFNKILVEAGWPVKT